MTLTATEIIQAIILGIMVGITFYKIVYFFCKSNETFRDLMFDSILEGVIADDLRIGRDNESQREIFIHEAKRAFNDSGEHKNHCPNCFTSSSDDKFHPGTCENCGAPRTQ